MLSGIVIVCRISYASYFLFDMSVYHDYRRVSSIAACHRVANTYHFGSGYPISINLDEPEGKTKFKEYCGPEGRDCKGE